MHTTATKQRLIQSFLKLASKEGVGNISLSRLANENNITKATIFCHFSSRDELIKNMYAYCDTIRTQQEISLEGDARAVLDRLVRHWIEFYTIAPVSYFYRIVSEQQYTDNLAKEKSHALWSMFYGQSQVVLETLADSHRLEIEELDLATIMFSSTIKHFIDEEILTGSDEDDWQIDRFLSKFCTLFTSSPGKGPQ
ncbi:MAG: TetR family transcriptional regulator [Sphaerochaetaceae bacterium]